MGISGLLPLLAPIHEPIDVRSYAGKRVAVDVAAWLYAGRVFSMRGCRWEREASMWMWMWDAGMRCGLAGLYVFAVAVFCVRARSSSFFNAFLRLRTVPTYPQSISAHAHGWWCMSGLHSVWSCSEFAL